MPQGRRKVPFSGKQKKQQLLLKKQSKSPQSHNLIRKLRDEESSDISEDSEVQISLHDNVQKINLQTSKDPRSKANRYVLQFHRESAKELKEMKEEARRALELVIPKQMEICDDFFVGYDFPKRPKWSFEMSKEQLDAIENRYFFKYITNLEKTHYDDMKSLSYCELNLETWRQLWRVLELSDIVLIIVDARFPTLMYPPSLYQFVTEELGRQMILVLNKIDLMEPEIILAWKKYFEEKYPYVKIVLFTSYPAYNLRGKQENDAGLKIRRRKGRMRMTTEGAIQVYEVCKAFVAGAVDLSSWEQKINDEKSFCEAAYGEDDDDNDKVIVEQTHEEKEFDFEEHVRYKDGIMTIGCIGFPNVGKSSLLNALMGKKVVSVSRTPGHTKHFQTIFLTKTVRLCDCPGLVFPSSTPRRIQVLMGSYPIAQLREPYSAIKYLAERINLQKLLQLKHPENEEEWSPIDVCDAFAMKRGFLTAKAARPDTYRAANSILRMALDGKISLALKPPGFVDKLVYWKSHPELKGIKEIQAMSQNDKEDDDDYLSETSEEDVAGEDSTDADNEDDDESAAGFVSPKASNPFALLTSPE